VRPMPPAMVKGKIEPIVTFAVDAFEERSSAPADVRP